MKLEDMLRGRRGIAKPFALILALLLILTSFTALLALIIVPSIGFGETQNVTELNFNETQPGNITDTTAPIITPKLIANANKDSFSSDEEPAFTFEYKTFKKSFIKNASAQTFRKSVENETIEAFVYDYSGKLADIEPEIEKIGEGKLSIKLPKERQFKPGSYKLSVDLAKDGITYTQEQDFTWGVLAINTHKSIYLPNEIVDIGIAVLDDQGRMVCDADVTVTITDPGNKETVLSTSNGLIKISPECCVYGVTNLPDYYTNYGVSGAGTYVMNLTAVTADGTNSITDDFTVQNSVDFDVARDGPTRIYPPVPYDMSFTIKANRNYTGLIKEYVPASFVITPQDGLTVTTVGDTKILTWNKNLVKGETYNVYYEFDAPDISPYLFVLGDLEIGDWQEVRQWQIASDPAESGDPYLLVVQGAPAPASQTWWEWIVVNPTDNTITVTEVRVKDEAGTDWDWTADNTNGYPTSGWADGGVDGYYWSGSETVASHSAKVFRSRPTQDGRSSLDACTMNWTVTITGYSPASRKTTVVGIAAGSGGGMFYNKPDDTTEQTEAGTYPNGLYAYLDEDINGLNLSAGTNYTFYVNVHEWLNKQIAAGGTLNITIPKEFTNVSLIDNTDFSDASVSGGGASNWTITGTNDVAFKEAVIHLSFNATTPTGYSTNSSWEFDTRFNGTGPKGEAVHYICEASVLVQAGAEDTTPPTITIDVPTTLAPVYRKGGEQFWVNFTYTEENPANYTVKIYNNTATINTTGVIEYPPGGTNQIANESFNLNSTAADGYYNVSVEMYDNSSNYNISYQNNSVVKDEVEPSVTAITLNYWVANNSLVTLNATINDTLSGVKNATVNVSAINSTINEAILTNQSGYWINNSIIADIGDTCGLKNLTITAYDNVSSCNNTINMTVGIDMGAPNVTAITLNQWYANNTEVTLNASITDTGSGVKNATVNVSAINSTINEAILTKQAGEYWTNISIIADRGDTGGLVNLTITAYDNVSLCNDTINMTVGIDMGAPNVTAITLNQWYANNTEVTLNASITDTGSGVKNATVNVSAINSTINEAILTKQAGDYWTNISIIADVGDTGGLVNLTITAYDNVTPSNCNDTINMTVGIDMGAPNVTAITLNQWYANNTVVTLNASITDTGSGVKNATVNVSAINSTINEAILTKQAGDYWTNISIIADVGDTGGLVNLTITAYDNVTPSNCNDSVNMTVGIDMGAPNVTAITLNQWYANNTVVTLNASITDTGSGVKNATVNVSAINSTINEAILTKQAGNYWTNTTIIADVGDTGGLVNLTITAYDNVTPSNCNDTINMTVGIDMGAPNVTAITLNQWYANNTEVTLNASITDTGSGVKNATVNVSAINSTINEAILTKQAGDYWTNISIIADVGDTGGLVNLTITAYDNVTPSNCNDTINMTVGIDMGAPNVTAITLNQWVANNTEVTLNASITDTGSGVKNATVNVSAINSTINEAILTKQAGNYWTNISIIADVGDTGGLVNLTITAYDNVTPSNCNDTINMTVGIDMGAPNVTAITLNQWVANNTAVTLNASITDTGSGVKNATVNVSAINSTINEAILTKQAGNYWTNISIIADVGDTGGLVNLTITAYDNVSLCNDTINMTVGIDEGTPNVTAITLNQWYANNTAVTLNASITDLRSGVKNATVNVSAINVTINEAFLTKQDGTDYWSNISIIADRGDTGGFVNLTITAYDNVSLCNDTINMTVGIDEGTPNVTAITLNQWYANNTAVTLNASITDLRSGVKNATVNVSAINSTINEAILTNQSGYWINNSIIADVGDTGGLKNLTITAYDNVSNCNASINMTVGIDATPPIVTAIEPINSYVVNGSTLELNVSVTDTGSGVNASAVWVNVSRINSTLGNFSLDRVGTSDYWNGSIIVNTTNEGTQNLTVYAYDNVSNCNSSVNLTADRDLAPPDVTAITVGVWTANNSVVTLNASITDDLSGVKNATVNVSAINETINDAILEKQGETNYWTNTSIIADKGDTGGLKNLTIIAYDNVSLCNDTINMTVGIDEGCPNVTAITLNQWYANNTAVALNASITDLRSSVKNATVNVSAINSTINEVILTKQTGDYWTNTTIIADRGDTGGLVNLTITAYDNVSLCNASINMTIGIDEGTPNVTAITLNQWYANNTEVTLNASITDPSPGSGVKNATVNVSLINSSIDEAILTNQSGYWINNSIIADVGDTGGLKNLTITAYDNVSSCNDTINMTVGIDATPPSVTAIEPINGHVVNGSTLELNVSVTDAGSGVNASAVRVNVSRINNTLGNFSLDRVGTSNYWNGSIIVNTTNEGTQNLTVYAYDNVSNCNSSVNLTAGRDLASPTVTAITIDVWTANSSVVTLNASITDDLSGVKNATVNVSAVNETINEAILEKQGETNYWTNTSIIADKGDTGGFKNLTITAYDNVSLCNNTINMTVGIDEGTPNVTAITLNQWYANNTAVTLNASITDLRSGVKNATVNVSAINSTINEVILTKHAGNYWTNTTIIADRGDTGGFVNLTITAYDNVSLYNNTINMTVGIDVGSPNVTAITLNQWYVNNTAVTLNASITDLRSGVKNATVNVSLINSTINEAILTNQSGYWINDSIIADVGDTGGLKNLTITAYDNASNCNNTINMTVGIDVTEPIVTAIEPINSYVVNGSTLELNVSVTDTGSGVNASAVRVNVSRINNTLGNFSLDRVGTSDYWNGSIIVNTTNEGTQNLTVYAYDNVSNCNSSVNLTAGRDLASPTVTAITIGVWKANNSVVTLNASITDDLSGVKNATVNVSAINASINEAILEKQGETNHWTNTSIIADKGDTGGFKNLTITAYDNVSLCNNTINMTLGIDATEPSVTAITLNQWVASSSAVTLNASITDTPSGVKNVTVNVSEINSTINEAILIKQDGDYWTNSTIIADRGDTGGLKNLTITAYDNVSNCNNTVNMTLGISEIIINEIMYNPDDNEQDTDAHLEWVELHNVNATASIDVSGWKLSTYKNEKNMTMPAGTLIEANGYLIIARNNTAFKHYYHHVNGSLVITNGSMQLNNEQAGPKTMIVLRNSTGAEIDNVTYSSSWGADGDGYTLERDSSWEASNSYSGTPLDTNSIVDSEPVILDYEPHDTNPTNNSGETMTFRVKANQTVNVTWYINGSVVHTNSSVDANTWAIYTNESAKVGYWNVTAFVNNTNGSDTMMWMWNVKKVVTISITYPLNGTEIPRGRDVGSDEDSRDIVPDNLTITARIYNYYNSSDPIPANKANCSFYWNNNLLGYNETNSTGYCQFEYDKTNNATGCYYNITVNFTLEDTTNYATNSTLNESTNKIKLVKYETALEKDNYRTAINGYKEGDAAILRINITKDGVLYDPTNITVYVAHHSQSQESEAEIIQYYPGDITKINTGQYYSKTIITDEKFNISGNWKEIHWYVWIEDNVTINGTKQSNIQNVSSCSHSDVKVQGSDASLNINVTNATATTNNANISIYDANYRTDLGLILLNESTLTTQGISRPASLYDNYTINITTPTNESLCIRDLNLSSTPLNVSPQIVTDYEGTMPATAKEMSSVIALNISDFNNATLTFPRNSLRVDNIYHCTDWNFTTANGTTWETISPDGFGYNATHFWFTVTSFTAYAGGAENNSNLTIWDETDTDMPYANKTKYPNQNVTFFANYTNRTSGAPITGANCTIWFNDTGEWYNMSYNSSTFYEYNRSFNTSAVFNYTINCNHTTFDNLSASDNITITPDNTAPNVTNPFVEEAVNNWVRNNTLITFNVTVNDTESGVKNATVNVSLINVTGGNIALTNVPGTDYWTNDTIIADIATEETKNLSIVTCDISGNCNSSVNLTVGVDDTPPASITSLNEVEKGQTWINWTWTNPSGSQPLSDFNYTMVYIDGEFKENTSDAYYKAEGLSAANTYEISTRTVDKVGNINTTWVNDTAVTKAEVPEYITGGVAVIIMPKINATTAGNSSNFTIRVRNTQTFNESVDLEVTLSGISAQYQANLTWFNWTSASLVIPAGGYVDKGLRANVSSDTDTGHKVFGVFARATLGTSKDYGEINVTST